MILLIIAMIPLCGSAELSTNLKMVKEPVSNNPRLTRSETYVDAEGNPVVPSDKGYATIRYTYGEGSRIVKEEFLDEHGAPVNSKDGYSVLTKRT